MFHMYLPLERSTPSSRCMPQYEQQDVTSSPAKLRNRILVIDDGDWVRNIIGIFLEHAGFKVCGEAADGVEGIEQAKKLKPDLIVLDLAMPRMNGAETASVLVRQCRTFRLFSLRYIKTWWDLRWQRLLALRPSWTKQRDWTSWSRAFTPCSRSNLRLNPLSHIPLYD